MLTFHRYQILDSTQDQALRLIREGEPLPFAVIADEQTSGRGRSARVWHSEKGRSLMLTLVEEMKAPELSGLSVFVGLQIIRFLKDSNLRLKWPNDIILNDHKVGGILIEAHTQGENSFVVIGVGLNLQTMQGAPYQGLGTNLSAEDLCENLSSGFLEFRAKGIASFVDECNRLLWRRGEWVKFQTPEGQRDLKIKELNSKGFLITEDGMSLQMQIDGEILFE